MTLQFDTLRRQNPGIFTSRLGNKAVYLMLGGKETLSPSYGDISDRVGLICDGAPVPLPVGLKVRGTAREMQTFQQP